MNDVGPLLFLGMRGAVAAVVLIPFMLREHRVACNRPRTVAQPDNGSGVWRFALMAGLIFFLAGAIQQTGIVDATVTNTGFLTALYVVVTPFLFWLVRRRRPGWLTWLSVLLAFVGVWALSGGSLEALNRGDVLVACSALFWASLIIVSGEASRHARPLTYTCIQFAVVAVLGLLAASVFEIIDPSALLRAAVPIIYVGVLSSALTFGIMAVAMQYVPAPRASILLAMETVFAAMAGYLFLGERLGLLGWLGAGLILLAVIIVQRSRDEDSPAEARNAIPES